ncbi:MAG TPA: type II secretion system secretin GspD [Bacteriovoracaceae bacterium]|nr:type II secretion system secretin GspD [Bacteriovoracaceae bacterium]
MKTRCHAKRFMGPLMIAALLMGQLPAYAQFNKYRSQTRFNANDKKAPTPPPPRMDETGTPDTDTMSAEDASAALKAAEKLEVEADTPDTEGGDGDEESAFDGDQDDDANQTTFGDRPSPELNATKKNPKYVNLNPETAFGPEIVESFDFPDTDIMEITRHMQKLTGINLILDKDVKGKVSIIAPTPITVGDAWKAYLAALNMAGYSLIKTGAFYKVINARDIRYTPTKIYTGNYTPDTENYVMRVISLKHVSAAEIARNFRPFMSRYGRIIDIKQTNTIIIADTGSNINRLAKMVKFLDVAGHEEALQIVKVKNSSAQEIAKLLDNILKGGSGGAAGRPGAPTPRFTGGGGGSESTSSISRIIAEPRTNSIIAMANAEGAKQLRELINKLDVKLVSSSSNRVHVYYLNYGDSEELSKTLSSIVTGNTAKDAAGGASRFSTFAGPSENPIFSAEVKITSDKNNNALVVTASPTDWLTLKDVIGRLDIPRDQVYVEGLILEANVTRERGFGVEYVGAYGQGNVQRTGFTTTTSATNGLMGLLASGVPQSLGSFVAGVGLGPSRTITPSVGGVAGAPIKVNAVNALIKAIASHSSTNVLATPQILALDNTEATFEVGDTVPIRNLSTNGQIQNISTTNQEAKLSLKITPQINKVTRFVKLKINQKIDDFKASADQAGGGGLPTTTRSAITEVMVRDRDTIAMGGLLRDREAVSHNKVPVLGDIPVLGWLFKNKSRRIEKVNLLFFMTPKILAPYAKTASSNTKEVLAKRTQGMKGMFEADEKDPNQKVSEDLNSKLDAQISGPLFDKSDADHYKNLNDEADDTQGYGADDETETPDYQDIKNSVQ